MINFDGEDVTYKCKLKLVGTNYYKLDIILGSKKIGLITGKKIILYDNNFLLKKKIGCYRIETKLSKKKIILKIKDYLRSENIDVRSFYKNLSSYNKNPYITEKCSFTLNKDLKGFYFINIHYKNENIGLINLNGFNMFRYSIEKFDCSEFEICDCINEKIIVDQIRKKNITLEDLLK